MIEPLDLSLIFAEQHPRDAARTLETLPASKTCAFLLQITDAGAAHVIGYMAADYAAICLPLLPKAKITPLFKELEIQTTVDIFRYLNAREKNLLVNHLPLNKRLAIQTLNKYSQNSVGAWMSTDYIFVTEDTTVEEAIEIIQGSDGDNQDYVYIVNSKRQFIGSVRTSLLLKASLHARISAIKNKSTEIMPARSLIQDTLDHPGWQQHRVLPVIEYDNRLVGILSYNDLHIALEQSHTEFTTQAANIGAEGINLFWALFNNFLQLLADLSTIMLRNIR